MNNFENGYICYRKIDEEHELEIKVYEDEQYPDYYYVQVYPEWDCHVAMESHIGSFSDYSMTLDQVNDWLDDFFSSGEVGSLIEDCLEMNE